MRTSESPGRRSRTRLARRWSILLGAVLLSLASPAVAATWAVVPSPNLTQFSNVLWGVDALSSGGAWAVGRAETGTLPIHRPVIERWNGTSWSISASPLPSGGGELRDVDAISASNAWAVGFTNSSNGNLTLTERWNGTSWSIVPSPSVSAQNHLLGVKTLSAGDAWAVGSHNVPGSWAFSTLTMRWTNGAWSIVPSPDTASFENHLMAIDGVSANDLWAVGHTRNGDYAVAEPLALHWDGSAWSIVPTPTANDATLEGVVALASNDVWAVGSMFSVAQLWHVPFALHWDGRSWTRVDVPSPTPQGGRLFGVAALSPTRVYAVGQASGIPSLVLRWNGTSWARETTPTTGTVWDAAAGGPGTVWAVGQRGNPNVGVGRTFTLRTTNG
jgi:hypothetical protein